MSLLRNSIIVGAATTLVGVGLMELSSESPLKTPKPSWYVQATLLTGLAGALGYALVNNRYTPEALELNADTYISKKMRKKHFGQTDEELMEELHESWLEAHGFHGDELHNFEEWVELHSKAVPRYMSLGEKKTVPLPKRKNAESWNKRKDPTRLIVAIDTSASTIMDYKGRFPINSRKRGQYPLAKKYLTMANRMVETLQPDDWIFLDWNGMGVSYYDENAKHKNSYNGTGSYESIAKFIKDEGLEGGGFITTTITITDAPMTSFRDFKAESPTDDELESWSERQDDGSMLVMIDEDGDSHTELTYDDEGELTNLKRFMAEVFEATKPRRRTTLTWTRGYDPAFVSMDGDRRVFANNPRPYNLDYYRDYTWNTEKNAYHIKGLPEGYHIHLWRPNRRGNYWQVRMKSPHEDTWKQDYNYEKKEMMDSVLHWYNRKIAIPQEEELTPMMLALKQMGGVSQGIQIQRVEVDDNVVQYFYSGKDKDGKEHTPTLFAECNKSRPNYVVNTYCSHLPPMLLNFVRGLTYIGEEAGNTRNVNRYNNDRKMWVNSKPAWFKNMCKQGIKQLYFTKDGWDENTIKIFNGPFFKFNPSNKTFKVRLPDEDGWTWHSPRPSTIRKMREKLEGGDIDIATMREYLFYEAIKKYQPEKLRYFYDKMLEGGVCGHPLGFSNGTGDEYLNRAGQLMCRRFKKKAQ